MASASFSIDALPEGGTLADPVHDAQGRTLLTGGLELSESMLDSLRRRDISSVTILEEDARSEEELAVERSRATKRVNALFRKTEGTANLELLQQLVLEHRLEPHS